MLPRAIILILIVLFLISPSGLPANAASEMPFEVAFPQEPDLTSFSDSWGDPRSGGRRHKGADLKAPKMTEVYAFADGVVAHVRHSRLAGRYVIIEHANGWETRYMHLNNDSPGTNNGRAPWSLTVASWIRPGARVRAGQLIGWSGNSGNAETSAPHTHFELHFQGRQVNPYPHLISVWERDLIASLEALYQEAAQSLLPRGIIYTA